MPIRRKETAWLEILNDQISTHSSLLTIVIYRNNIRSLSNPLSLSTEAVSHSISPQIRSQLLINHLTEIPSLNILLNSLPTTTDSLTALNRAVLVCDFFYKVLKIGLLSEGNFVKFTTRFKKLTFSQKRKGVRPLYLDSLRLYAAGAMVYNHFTLYTIIQLCRKSKFTEQLNNNIQYSSDINHNILNK